MEPLTAILVFGLAMSLIALSGSLVLMLEADTIQRIILPLVALSSGSLIGGALFHLMPDAVARMGNSPRVYACVAGGFLTFLILEQLLYWHHCHRPAVDHRQPMGVMLLIGDGVHNFIGGLAIGAVFIVDFRLGVLAWAAAAVHEVPQELGDFGVLLHSGWSRGRALVANFATALTFPLGGLLAWSASSWIDIDLLIPFAAGNFLYIGAVDLIPQFKAVRDGGSILSNTFWWTLGAGVLAAAALVGPNH